ncbi:MAG: HEAT repeat domain-containing protein [Vampirovibrionales bacterium]
MAEITFEPLNGPHETALAWLLDSTLPSGKRLDALLIVVDGYQNDWFDLLLNLLNNPEEAPDIRASVGISLGKLANNPLSGITTSQHAPLIEALRNLQHSENPLLRRYAPIAMALTGQSATIPWVVEGLKDPDLDVFHSAAEALGQYGREAVPYLLEVLAQGHDDAQCVAAWKLGELGFDEALEPLMNTIKDGLDGRVSSNLTALCVWALGEIGTRTPAVLQALHQAEQSSVPDIATRAQWALKKIARNWN